MTSNKCASGSCLCGAVCVHASSAELNAGACHCGMCVKWGGAALLSVHCGSGVSFSDEDAVQRYQSSEWAERGFCKHCGTHLFYRLIGQDNYSIPVGLFDDNTAFHMSQQIFIDKKPGYYSFADDTENLTEAETFARYAPPE